MIPVSFILSSLGPGSYTGTDGVHLIITVSCLRTGGVSVAFYAEYLIQVKLSPEILTKKNINKRIQSDIKNWQ